MPSTLSPPNPRKETKRKKMKKNRIKRSFLLDAVLLFNIPLLDQLVIMKKTTTKKIKIPRSKEKPQDSLSMPQFRPQRMNVFDRSWFISYLCIFIFRLCLRTRWMDIWRTLLSRKHSELPSCMTPLWFPQICRDGRMLRKLWRSRRVRTRSKCVISSCSRFYCV